MKVKVVGYKALDFAAREMDNKHVSGVSLKCVFDNLSDEDLVGQDITKIWLPSALVQKVGFVPDIGSDVELNYDFDGKRAVLSSYSLISDKETEQQEVKK